MEEEQREWIEVSPFRCPSGCGTCCERFIPDIWEIEALYIAAQLMIEGRQSNTEEATSCTGTGRMQDDVSTCPLYRSEGRFHCTVYETRPLVCRVFGFAGDRDKWGHLRFTPCRFAEIQGEHPYKGESQRVVHREGWVHPERGGVEGTEHRKRLWTEQELLSQFSRLPPDMTLYARKVQAIDPSWAGEREPLDKALPRALMKLRWYAWFSSPDKAPDKAA